MTFITPVSRKNTSSNTTQTLLKANESFEGSYESTSGYESITINISSNVNSSNCGVLIYFSNDITSTVPTNKFTYYGGLISSFDLVITGNYFKVKYINGIDDQTTFSLNIFMNTSTNNKQIVKIDDSHLDIYNKLRISIQNNVINISHVHCKNILDETEYTENSGVSNYDHSNSCVDMVVTGVGKIIRQSKQYAQYHSGTTFKILISAIINVSNNDSNTVSRLGYFDHVDGIFFEYSNKQMKICYRNNGTDIYINQTNWNTDSYNGTGTSKLNISFYEMLLYFIDFEWLGVGLIKVGFYYGGIMCICHCFVNSSMKFPMISSPCLPVRHELISTGGNATLRQISAVVNSEGISNIKGTMFSIFNCDKTPSSFNVIKNKENFILGIRLKNNVRNLVKLKSISLLCPSSANIMYKLYYAKYNDTPVGTYNDVNSTYSLVEYCVDATTIDTTNWILLYSGMFSKNINIDYTTLSDTNSDIILDADIYTTTFRANSVILTCVSLDNSNEKMIASLCWTEYN